MMTARERFLNACKGDAVDRKPIWIMRQAGRYLPEYRKLKESYDFLTMVKTPELATEVTLQPLKRFPLDAAILFSDILVIPEAMGQPYHFREKGGIGMDYRIDSQDLVDKLSEEGICEKLSYVGDALSLLRKDLGEEKALLGFGGSPWTLATYMVEGGSSKEFSLIKALQKNEPKMFESLMTKLTAGLIEYFKMQITHGVDAIQIFDSWGGLCDRENYWEISLKWIKQIISALPAGTPIILYAKGMGQHMDLLLETGAQVISVDWTVHLDELRAKHPGGYALQGNLDPEILNTTPEQVREAAMDVLDRTKNDSGHIFNLGHGIMPQAKIENVETLIDTVQNYR